MTTEMGLEISRTGKMAVNILDNETYRAGLGKRPEDNQREEKRNAGAHGRAHGSSELSETESK